MDLMSTGLSGLRAASLGITAAANNIANINTPDYQARRADQDDQGGNRADATRESQEMGRGSNNVDLATEITNLQVQSGAYKANLKVIETANEILGSTLDMKA